MISFIVMPSWPFRLSSISTVKWGILSLKGAIWRNYNVVEMLPCGILLAVGAVEFVAGAQILSIRETRHGLVAKDAGQGP